MAQSEDDARQVSKVLVLDEGKVLLLKRIPEIKHGLKWDFPGGHVEAGESAERAAAREVMEEADLSIQPSDLKLIYSSGKTYFYITEKWSGVVKLSDEHTDFAWVGRESYRKYDAGSLYNKIIERLFRAKEQKNENQP